MSGAGARMNANLTTQGYCITDGERRELAAGLRFSTGACFVLVVIALALHSAAMVLALCTVGLVAGFRARHPFDHVWNHAIRRLIGGPPLPPNPRRRRDAFKLATAWLALVGHPVRGRREHRCARAWRAPARRLRDRNRDQSVPAIRAVRVARAPAGLHHQAHHCPRRGQSMTAQPIDELERQASRA
jgi:hypothetical protein